MDAYEVIGDQVGVDVQVPHIDPAAGANVIPDHQVDNQGVLDPTAHNYVQVGESNGSEEEEIQPVSLDDDADDEDPGHVDNSRLGMWGSVKANLFKVFGSSDTDDNAVRQQSSFARHKKKVLGGSLALVAAAVATAIVSKSLSSDKKTNDEPDGLDFLNSDNQDEVALDTNDLDELKNLSEDEKKALEKVGINISALEEALNEASDHTVNADSDEDDNTERLEDATIDEDDLSDEDPFEYATNHVNHYRNEYQDAYYDVPFFHLVDLLYLTATRDKIELKKSLLSDDDDAFKEKVREIIKARGIKDSDNALRLADVVLERYKASKKI